MKIKVRDKAYEEVLALPVSRHLRPRRPSRFFRWLVKTASASELKKTNFHCEKIGIERLGKDEPALFLMNHSSFIDLKIAFTVLYPRSFNTVCTSDGFVGKKWLMRHLGCIPTNKFMTDIVLVRDMLHATRKLKSSVLMYPEASYSFDGTATPLPDSLGQCLKLLDVPVVMIRTYGAFAHDPLYNGLKLREVDVSAEMRYLLSREEIKQKSVEELNAILNEQFTFDNFHWQQENRVCVDEPFRADGLNRVLYKCPQCLTEGSMEGKGTELCCRACGKRWKLDEYGALTCADGEPIFTHVPDWYAWERSCVREELEAGSYRLDVPVDILMMKDMDCVWHVGEGTLHHGSDGFLLEGCEGKLRVSVPPAASYSLYADYYWYEIGDMICIGDRTALYYCFPKSGGDIVAKTRLATEELYKMTRPQRSRTGSAKGEK